jgi:hypothetical protein
MTVAVPLAGLNVNLDVTANHLTIEGKNGIFEITTSVVAGSARIYRLELLAVVCNAVRRLTLPEAGNEFF